MRMRVWGFQCHYFEAHNWVRRGGLRLEHEYHLATMLFQMDSSIECMVYAANALGNAFAAQDFHDVTDLAALRRVNPGNVLETGAKGRPGYAKHFPRFTHLVRTYRPLIEVIMENHDVSKHREMNFVGGKMRMDPPYGFYEAHGIDGEHPAASHLAPMETILLLPDPKVPPMQRLAAAPREEPIIFERVAELYARFMSAVGYVLLSDTQSVSLTVHEFRR
jgi:hypothetical protein